MNFDLSEEQKLLKDTVERWLARSYDFETRSGIVAGSPGWSREAWSQMADLGLLGLPFGEEDGGFGGGAVETMIVMEAFGRALVVEPYLTSIVLAGAVLRHGASPRLRQALVPGIADASLIFAVAHDEAQARWDISNVATRAEAVEGGWRISGTKSLVLHAEAADRFIVSARTGGEQRDPTGIGLFLIDRTAPGVVVRGYATQDGQCAAEVHFENVRVSSDDVLGDPSRGFDILEQAIDEAVAAIASEAIGAMDEALAMTVDYLKTRAQFGVSIGSFQAVQHRAADMFVAIEQARSMALYAVMSVAEEDPIARRKAMSAAKVQIARSARFVGQQAIQLHGGIGMTMEYKVGHLFKRLTMIEKQFGDLDHHLDRLAVTGSLMEKL